jgi:hypothetical protein
MVSVLFWMWLPVGHAADSYRFLHVTIDTPWMIFLGLLVIVLSPFILMAVLHWYFAYKKTQEEKLESSSE